MLIFVAGLIGVVALPFLILMLPVMLWMAIPTAVMFGVGYALQIAKRRQQQHTLWLPLHRS
jgi:hypothetical protein